MNMQAKFTSCKHINFNDITLIICMHMFTKLCFGKLPGPV